MSNQKIRNDAVEPRYYARIPNMATDDLDPFQLALYVHYKRVAGDNGYCNEDTRNTAKNTKMSVGKVASTRRELAALGYIELYEPNIKNNPKDSILITIINRWKENNDRYEPKPEGGEQVAQHPTTVHEVNSSVHEVNSSDNFIGGTVHEVKQRIYKEKPIEEEKEYRANAQPAAPVAHASSEGIDNQAFNAEPITDTPTPRVKKKAPPVPQHPPKENPFYEFCRKMADICEVDFAVMEGKILRTYGKPLWDAGYRDPDLEHFAIWFKAVHWRGKKGESPTLEDVKQDIRKAKEWTPSAQRPPSPPAQAGEKRSAPIEAVPVNPDAIQRMRNLISGKGGNNGSGR